MDETKNLIAKCMEIRLDALPDEVVDRAKYFLLDYIGVAARGSLTDSSKAVQRVVTRFDPGSLGAVIIGTAMKAPPSQAAIANGAAAHSLEMDDLTNEASLHPGVAIFSAGFDAAHFGSTSGAAFIEAVVAGYEVMIRLGICLNPTEHYRQGFHPTGTCGTLGSAIAASKIMELEPPQMTSAIGIAGSQAAASMEFLTGGAFTKRLHPGWAAHAGIFAALLAREGFTGPHTIIEGKSGFLRAYSAKSDLSKLLQNWGAPFNITRTSIKPHACCRYKQGPLDGILEITRRERLRPEDIEQVTIGMLKTGIPIVSEPREQKYNPRSVVDSQFSMPFGAAVAILYGKASLDEYREETLESAAVKEMMKRIVCIEDEELEKDFPKKWPAKVTITTKTGEKYHSKIDFPKGDPENPLTWNELIEKFNNLTKPVFSKKRQEEIVERVRGLEREADMKAFAGALSIPS